MGFSLVISRFIGRLFFLPREARTGVLMVAGRMQTAEEEEQEDRVRISLAALKTATKSMSIYCFSSREANNRQFPE